METTIDNAGRITIPERLRKKLGIKPGSKLRIESDHGAIRLRPAASKEKKARTSKSGQLVRKGRVLVWTGPVDPRLSDMRRFIEELDQERDRQIWNPKE